MRVSISVSNYTWPGGAPAMREHLSALVTAADEAGVNTIWLPDHVIQADPRLSPEAEMLETYTTLGFIAARTERVRLGSMVTPVSYRSPSVLVKAVTTLDVLTGGRAWFGVGAGYSEGEARDMGLEFPATAERFERLTETLEIAFRMWAGDTSAYEGTHYQLAKPINSPASLSQPRPKVLIGGTGEKKTLRLVAQYAQACNLFNGPDLERKLDVLRGHCEVVGRPYEEIEKTVMFSLDVGERGEKVDAVRGELERLAKLGVHEVHGWVPRVWELTPLEIIGRELVPAAAEL
jgi:F420-dependent oxidoreductase-like protein